MAEARPETEQEFREAFGRIEAAVDERAADLRALGFWGLVGRVKRDPTLSDRCAEQIGRIDRKAFEAAVRVRAPLWVGTLVLGAGTVVGAAATVVALRASSRIVAGAALLAAGGIWSVSTHSLAHLVVGQTVGVRFSDYFLGGPFPPRPGVKIDYASYLRADPNARAVMHASGAIATKVSPFVALAFAPAAHAPAWSVLGLLALGIGQIVTDILFSVRSSDWKKVMRERAIARERAPSGR